MNDLDFIASAAVTDDAGLNMRLGANAVESMISLKSEESDGAKNGKSPAKGSKLIGKKRL